MSYKQITPDVTEIKTGTPAIKVGDKYVVGGIGGNFIPGGTSSESSVDVTLGQIDADGNFQPLAFDGQTASNDGDPEAVESYYGWNGTLKVPDKGIKVGEATEYYKCASIDTEAKTWTGYLAVLGDDGTYSFDGTATTGLTYGTGYTPAVGKIYSTDATVVVSNLYSGNEPPEDGLVLYMPMRGIASTADTGQSIEYYEGSASIVTYNGITGMTGARMRVSRENVPVGGTPRTISYWLYGNADGYHYQQSPSAGDNMGFFVRTTSGNLYVDFDYNAMSFPEPIAFSSGWQHVALTYETAALRVYVNGSFVCEVSTGSEINTGTNELRVSATTTTMAALRVYNRVLDDTDIGKLASEFTPTA